MKLHILATPVFLWVCMSVTFTLPEKALAAISPDDAATILKNKVEALEIEKLFAEAEARERDEALKGEGILQTIKKPEGRWIMGSTTNNLVEVTFENITKLPKRNVSYLISLTRMDIEGKSKPVVIKYTGVIKSLSAGGEKTIILDLNSRSLYRKLKEGSYNVEVFVNETFLGSNVFGMVHPKSLSASVKVKTSHDGYSLPRNHDLKITVNVEGKLPKGGFLDIVLMYQSGSIRYVDMKKLPVNFKGEYTFVLPYVNQSKEGSFQSYNLNEWHKIYVNLHNRQNTSDSNSVIISQASTKESFFVGAN